MIVNDEALYKKSLLNYVISFDGQFIFTDVDNWTPTTNQDIDSTKTAYGGLVSVKTNINAPEILVIIANITRQQRSVLQSYINDNRYAMLLFTNTHDQTLSFKYSQAILKQPDFFKKIVTAQDIYITLNFQCTDWEWA